MNTLVCCMKQKNGLAELDEQRRIKVKTKLTNAITLPSVALRECDPQRVQNDIESFF
jgi:hypothetical protein